MADQRQNWRICSWNLRVNTIINCGKKYLFKIGVRYQKSNLNLPWGRKEFVSESKDELTNSREGKVSER